MEASVGGSYYEKYNIRKFGFWLGEDKKKELQELDEMNGDSAKKLIRLFNKEDIKAHLFVIFTTGGIDFVGGYTFYNLLKSSFAAGSPQPGASLGRVALAEKTGEDIHAKFFE